MRLRGALICLLFIGFQSQAAEPKRGVVVLTVPKQSASEEAGIKPGDVLEKWSRGRSHGKLNSLFDAFDLENEQCARGNVSVTGRREGRKQTWLIKTSSRPLDVRPALPPNVLKIYEGAQALRKTKPLDAGNMLMAAANNEKKRDRKALKVWLMFAAAETFKRAAAWDDVDRAYAAAVANAKPYGPHIEAVVLGGWGATWVLRQNWAEAESRYQLALSKEESLREDSLTLANALTALADVAWRKSDLDTAQKYFQQALDLDLKLAPVSMVTQAREENLANVLSRRGDQSGAIQLYLKDLALAQKLRPGTIYVANTLDDLGIANLHTGNLELSENYARQASAFYQRADPESLDTAYNLNNLGGILNERGDLAGADQSFRRALTLKEKLIPGSPSVAITLSNLGDIARERGALDDAERYYTQSLALREKLQPDSLEVAESLEGLGLLYGERRDPDPAEKTLEQGLAIVRRVSPDTGNEAEFLSNLGEVALLRGNVDDGERYFERAEVITRRTEPDSLSLAGVEHNLAIVALQRNDLDHAERLFRTSLGLEERLAPGSLLQATSLLWLGSVAERRSDMATAGELDRRALDIRQKLAPGSKDEAEALYAVGTVLRKQGRNADAGNFFCEATTALEKQSAKLGGTEDTKAAFRANFANYYRDCLESLVSAGRAQEAFGVLERFHARSLANMLAERDLNFDSDAPASLLRERTLNAADYDKAQSEVAGLSPTKDAGQIEQLLSKMRDLNADRERIAERIREASPRLASLQYPQPLDVTGTQQALDPGTLMLAYSVGKSETVLFAITGQSFTVHRLKVGDAELRERVEAFRNLIERRSKEVDRPAQDLYELLLRPADAALETSERVLVVPDGPLQTLPFAALRRDGRYLVEWKPLHNAASATVYVELRKRRVPGNQPMQLAAFGDPKYARAGVALEQTALRSVKTRGFQLEELPASRDEVQRIASLYPDPAKRVFLGADATEERAKAVGRDVRYIHFATHGLLDQQFPLNSALVLTIPDGNGGARENGLLQAWEVFEQVRINADLVTLSACETGLGQELDGEGLVGLTRAFQYAGARSILASLWSVADSSTADLMERFYQHLQSGQSKDEALRAAQMEEMRQAENAHPFYWAAFTLIGDWASAH